MLIMSYKELVVVNLCLFRQLNIIIIIIIIILALPPCQTFKSYYRNCY